jgi:group I intron endonuclease
MYEIYIITNSLNAKQYVGITKNLEARWYQHRITNGSSPYLHAAIKKYGIDAFVFTHIATAYDIEAAFKIEKLLIIEHNTKSPHGYNLTDGGDGVQNFVFSEETKKLISEKSKSMWMNEEHVERQRAIRTSVEYRQKQSERSKAAWEKPELKEKLKKPKNHGDKIRAIKQGHKQSEETIAKRVLKNTGKKRSDEVRQKMSAANKAAWIIRRAKKLAEKEVTNHEL